MKCKECVDWARLHEKKAWNGYGRSCLGGNVWKREQCIDWTCESMEKYKCEYMEGGKVWNGTAWMRKESGKCKSMD